jgi:hypothetical protein
MHGRVDTLFIDCSRPLWGRIDAASGTIELHDDPLPGDADLIEVAAGETLRHDGHVFPMDQPASQPEEAAEALLRY